MTHHGVDCHVYRYYASDGLMNTLSLASPVAPVILSPSSVMSDTLSTTLDVSEVAANDVVNMLSLTLDAS